MKPRIQKTFTPTPGDLERKWVVVDAAGVPLGRLASVVVGVLRGKHKPTYAPHVDGGDFVIVVNAAEVVLTGGKEGSKVYHRHSGYPGGLRSRDLSDVRRRHPARLVESAVKGMLPKNRLGRRLFTKLKVYAGPDHPHAAQKPEPLQVRTRKVEA